MIINSQSTPETAPQYIPIIVPEGHNGIALVGDVPYDEKAKLPFQNAHFGTVASWLDAAGVEFNQCIQANLLPFYPPNGTILLNDKSLVDETLAQLKILVPSLKVIILFGRNTLRWFKIGASGVDDERGFPFRWNGVTTIATYHPKEVYLEYDNHVVCEADVVKAVKYAKNGWKEPAFNINYAPTYNECITFLSALLERKAYISTDWESRHSVLGPYSIATCIAIGINNSKAFVIPFEKEGGQHYFSFDEERVIWKLLARVLETCPQLGHNALHYDHWFAAYWNKILMHVVDDTQFAHWEVYTEMLKSLSFCSSLYLDVPFWKDELKLARAGKIPRDREFLYSGRDACNTIGVAMKIGEEIKELPPAVKCHYRFNVRTSRIFQYMSLRGCFINRDLLSTRISQLTLEADGLQQKLESEIKRPLKVTSPKQMKQWLYDDLKIPPRFKVVKLDDGSSEERETADFLTLAYAAREYPDIPGLMTAAVLRKQLKRISSLKSIQTGPNGECYWNFNLVGTDSGRASGYKPNNGLGVQPQNPDKRDRDLFLPGPGKVWGKCDLEGADAWTVAGMLAVLGDDTMLKDLRAGIKPAQILAIARIVGEDAMTFSQEKLKELLKVHKPYLKTKDGKQLYDTTKSVSHGTNYMMTAPTMHVTIFQRSKAELYVPVRECEKFRALYLRRYRGLEKLYNYIPTIINSHGFIDCPSGMRRVFFGRNDNHRTRVGLSLLPQNNTAFATNRALHHLYYQPFNRRQNGVSLIVEPMNQVHDEMDIAFSLDEISQVRDILTKATDFDSEIWGVRFKIPFDPNYGDNWGDCDTPIFGED